MDSEDWKLYRDTLKNSSRTKKLLNKKRSTEILLNRGIKFVSNNGGIHLVIGDFDFWPSTGLFKNRKTGKKGRGVFNLIKVLGVDNNQNSTPDA